MRWNKPTSVGFFYYYCVVIRTSGDQCLLTIDAANDDVLFYGFAKKIDVKNIKSTSLHIYGSVNQLQLEKGHVAVETTGIVFDVVQVGTAAEGTGASITNGGFIAGASLSEHTSEEAKTAATAQVSGTVGGDYEISSLAQLEAFRDAVNSGNNFATITVKLTSDITLNDGWKPIGEGSRKVQATGTAETGVSTFFAGTFDGQNHTISNLNNKGFKPTTARLVKDDGVDTYAYGLFALVDGATITNLKLTNVDIDAERYSNARLDSAAGLVGYSKGDLTVTNITVTGSLSGYDCISGIVGRINLGSHTISITNCTNNANITANVVASGIVRIYSGAAGHSATLANNTNTGTITSLSPKNYYGGICVFTQTNVTLTESNNTNNGTTATIEAVAGTSDNRRLD